MTIQPFMVVKVIQPEAEDRELRLLRMYEGARNAPAQSINYELLANARFGPDAAAMQNAHRAPRYVGATLDVTDTRPLRKRPYSEKQLAYMRRMKRLLKVMRFCGCEVHA